MKVLVTGGAGFIGQHVVAALIDAGHYPVVFDRRRERADFLGDVLDPVAVTEALAHVDGFIHLAACLGTQETIQNPRPAATTNIFGALNVFEAAAAMEIPGTYIGVGNWWMENSYSISKTCAERFVAMFNTYRGTRINIVRAMNAYGPGQAAAPPFAPGKVRKITPAFVCRALCGMPVEVYGDGSQVSDMVYVGDVAFALVRALERAAVGDVFDRAVEVGPAVHATVNEVAETVLAYAGMDGAIVHLPMRPGEIAGAEVTADVETLALVGLQPCDLISLDAGMETTVGWFRANEGVTWRRP